MQIGLKQPGLHLNPRSEMAHWGRGQGYCRNLVFRKYCPKDVSWGWDGEKLGSRLTVPTAGPEVAVEFSFNLFG